MNSKRTIIFFGFILAFLFVWEQLQSVRLGYRLELMHAQVRAQEDKNAYLRLELERLHSPQRLSQAAQERLNMSPPSPEALIVMGEPAAKTASRGRASEFLSRLFSEPRNYR